MKTPIKNSLLTVALASVMHLATANNNPEWSATAAAQQTATKVLAALQHSSADEYALLFPSLSHFHQLMDDNVTLYGNHLSKAKEDFAALYDNRLLPEMYRAFDDLQRTAKKNGIDWSTAQVKKIEVEDKAVNNFDMIAFTIVFTSGGKDYLLQVEKGFVVDGECKMSHHSRIL